MIQPRAALSNKHGTEAQVNKSVWWSAAHHKDDKYLHYWLQTAFQYLYLPQCAVQMKMFILGSNNKMTEWKKTQGRLTKSESSKTPQE